MKSLKPIHWSIAVLPFAATTARASEADLAIPDLWQHGRFDTLGGITPGWLLFIGSFVILGTLGISLYQLVQIRKQPAHKSMLEISEIIFQTCKTYLIQQGKFLLMLFAFIAVAMAFYLLAPWLLVKFNVVQPEDPVKDAADVSRLMHIIFTVILVLLFALVGM